MDAETPIVDGQVVVVPASDGSDALSPVQANVKRWLRIIEMDKRHWDMDYKRMESNMNFTAGIQWRGQDTINSERYVANVTLQEVNQKEAQLYAKNPTVVAKRRPRMDFAVWDERNETLMQAQNVMAMTQQMAQGNPTAAQGLQMNPVFQSANALIQDYQRGMMVKEQTDRVGKTLEILYKFFCDSLSPDFKEQMKEVVRRTVICNVGYVRQEFLREPMETQPTGTFDTMQDTIKRAKMLLDEFKNGLFDEDDAKMDVLKGCLASIQMNEQKMQTLTPLQFEEKLAFLFPKSRNIIADKRCTNLVGFINADHVTEQHHWPLSYVNSYFEKDIKAGELKGRETTKAVVVRDDVASIDNHTGKEDPEVCVNETFDKVTKTKFWTCDGYLDWLQEPEPISPITRAFYPWFALVFNKVECDDSTKTTAIGPSDVQQMKHPQIAINVAREELREHRKANAPQTFYKQGAITEGDKKRLTAAPTGAWVALEAMQNGEKVGDIISPKPVQAIEPLVYDTAPMMSDIQSTTGQAPMQPQGARSKKGETATAAAIQEQNKVSTSASNVDDLDNLLNRLAENGAELLFYECQPETVKRIVGVGAVFPQTPQARKEFAQSIYLEIKMGSSGRPNQQLDISKFERMAPMMLQIGGGNPQFVQALARKGAEIMEFDIDLSELVAIPLQNVAPSQPLSQDVNATQSPSPQIQMAPGNPGMQGIQPGAQPVQNAGVQRQ